MAKKKKVSKKSITNREMWFEKYKKDSTWGFIPINWKGWVALLSLIGLNVFSANYFNLNKLAFDDWSGFLVVFLLSLVVFILIAKKTTR